MKIKSRKKYEATFVSINGNNYTRYYDTEDEVAYWERSYPTVSHQVEDSLSLKLEQEFQKTGSGKCKNDS